MEILYGIEIQLYIIYYHGEGACIKVLSLISDPP